MRQKRGFIMGVVLIALLALSLAGATAVLLSSSEIDMVGSLKKRRQLEACAEAGVDATASNIPLPANAPAVWAVDPNQAVASRLYQAKQEHVDATSVVGGTLSNPTQTLSNDAASEIVNAASAGSSIVNPSPNGLDSLNPPTPAATQKIQVFRMVSTCAQGPSGAGGSRLEAEGVYVYNPKN